ncbi:MAG: hypothetical protein MJZ01_08730 [Bacteroidales bacterium]|nr:hypothetical protein [Bacteroidales bacterium]
MKKIIYPVIVLLCMTAMSCAWLGVGKKAAIGTPVDLGLTSGTLWADRNIGAEAPEEMGQYYAWGETAFKLSFAFPNYKWCKGSYDTLTKYCTDSSYGDVDNKTELDDVDDVAVQTWGRTWKMPTREQLKELYNECYWVLVHTYNGKRMNGYIVYKARKDSDKGVKTNDDAADASYNVASDPHIFLPATGYIDSKNLCDSFYYGYYWSRSLGTDDSHAYYLYFHSDLVYYDEYCRDFGFQVRPVCKATK